MESPQYPRPNNTRELLRLPVRAGDYWVLRKDPTREVLVRGLHRIFPDRVLLTWQDTGRRTCRRLTLFHALFKIKGSLEPRLDKILERIALREIQHPLDWAEGDL